MPGLQREAAMSPSSAYPAHPANRTLPASSRTQAQVQNQNPTRQRPSAPAALAATLGVRNQNRNRTQDQIHPTAQAFPTETFIDANGRTQQRRTHHRGTPSNSVSHSINARLRQSQGNPPSTLNTAQQSRAYRTPRPSAINPASIQHMYTAHGHPLPAVRQLTRRAWPNPFSPPAIDNTRTNNQPNRGRPAPTPAPHPTPAREAPLSWVCCQCSGKSRRGQRTHIDWTTEQPCPHVRCGDCMLERRPALPERKTPVAKDIQEETTEDAGRPSTNHFQRSNWGYSLGNYNPPDGVCLSCNLRGRCVCWTPQEWWKTLWPEEPVPTDFRNIFDFNDPPNGFQKT